MMKMFLIIGTLFFSVIINAQEIKKIQITELEQTIKESEKPLIVNFWATYCVPCIEEMPYFLELSKKYEVELLLVSLDLQDFYPDKIKKFAAKINLQHPLRGLMNTMPIIFAPKWIRHGQGPSRPVFL
jgi:thiol-disulfide isomerase/thioredoxin